MKKSFNKVIVLTMLFLIVSSFNLFLGNKVWANTVPETLETIVNSSGVACHQTLNEDGTVLDSTYIMEVDLGSVLHEGFVDYYEQQEVNGTLIIRDSVNRTEKEYVIQIKAPDVNGNYVVIGEGVHPYQIEGNDAGFGITISNNCPPEVWANSELQFVLVPTDGSESIVYSHYLFSDEQEWSERFIPITTVDVVRKTTLGDAAWGIIDGDTQAVGQLITETIATIALPVGDSFLHMISLAIGEPVTIDKAVFNEIQKLKIDFFEPKSTGEGIKPLKDIMYDVVNTWYGIFMDIAITVYLILLVYIGIKILFASTGSTKADYKKTFMAWVMGVAMLMFFPYVMKYTIELNNAFCIWLGEGLSEIQTEINNSGGNFGTRVENGPTNGKEVDNLKDGSKKYGTNAFVIMMLGWEYFEDTGELTPEELEIINNAVDQEEIFSKLAISKNYFGNNAMMRIRFIAANTWDLPLTVVYFILIGQLLAILIVYYKRVFILAFLITIFPIVVITYPLNKIGDMKHNSFGTWFKEFVVNILVQTFHAVTYVVVVSVGVNSYIQNDNWLFMILCILFLFEGEKIIRAIFNVKSAANSIGDLAVAGAMAWGVAGKMFPGAGSGGGKKKSAENAENKAKDDRESAGSHVRPGQTRSAEQNMAAATGGTTAGGANASGSGSGRTTGASTGGNVGSKANTGGFNFVKKQVDSWRPKKRIVRYARYAARGAGYFAGKTLKWAGKGTGAVLGFTLGAAQGKAATAVATGITGAKMGESMASGVTNMFGGAVGKARDMVAGHAIAREILNGEHDANLGIAEADSDAEKARNEAMRKIMAKAARRKGTLGDTAAEIKFIKDSLDRIKKE